MYRYVTQCSNHVHQLVVSVSRHFFITSDGRVKYQKKPFEISLAKLSRAPREHVVHYLIRDHFSGILYADIASSRAMLPVESFLQSAWCEKQLHPFLGLPETLTVPRTVSDFFPNLVPLLDHLGVEIIDATSGFQAGVRDLRTWEDELRYRIGRYPLSFEDLLEWTERLSLEICTRWPEEKSKAALWAAGLEEIRVPSSEDFSLFLNPPSAR